MINFIILTIAVLIIPVCFLFFAIKLLNNKKENPYSCGNLCNCRNNDYGKSKQL